jgi:hypothetical protein
VSVHRDAQAEFDFGQPSPRRAPMKPIVGFTVEDDGVGFTAANMSSFETADSDKEQAGGLKGDRVDFAVVLSLWVEPTLNVDIYTQVKQQLAARVAVTPGS